MTEQNLPENFQRSDLVPELLVTDLAVSRRFWCGLCGFMVAYERPEDGFVYLDRTGTQFMLVEAGASGRRWMTGTLEKPFGRGINFQITVTDLTPLLACLAAAGWPLYLAPEEKWYRVGNQRTGVEQFLVQDPDGYLLRFARGLGVHAAP